MILQRLMNLRFYLGKKRLVGIFLFIILLLAIPLTVFVSQQQQEIRQRAEGSACITSPFPLKVPVLVLEYFPPDPNDSNSLDGAETGWKQDATYEGRTIKFWEQKTDEMIDAGIKIINEATKFHGYKDPNALQFLDYFVLENKKIYEPIPRGYPVDIENGKYKPNYRRILDELNICDYVDNEGVKEVWMYGYHNENGIIPDESRMSSRYGDISNSLPKENQLPEELRMPICVNSYVLYNFTYQPGGKDAIGNNIHNRLHQIENIIPFAENKWPPVREDRPESNIKDSIFWGDFSEYTQDYTKRENYKSSCGNSHNPPNWIDIQTGYAYNLINQSEFNCETWHPDDSQTAYIKANCERWGCNDVGFYKWWLQNIPGYNNGIVYNGQKMRNWWEAMYDLNAFIDKGRSLFGESLFCPIQSVNISTPISSAIPSAAPALLAADVNGDGCVSISDFNEWLYSYEKNGTPRNSNYKPDMDGKDGVNLSDYNLWLTTMKSGQNLCGQ